MAKKARSRFWVVSTHVLTTGFAMPFVANVAAYAAIAGLGIRGPAALALGLAILAVGYIGGTFYSLSYLRKEAAVDNWTACTAPAVIAFVVLASLGLALNIAQLAEKSAVVIAGLAVFYVFVVVAFAAITRSGFAANELADTSPPTGA